MNLWPALEGLLLGGGLIIAIGAQNAFILRQGLLRQHVFILCLIASSVDAMLVVAGVLGVGALVQSNPSVLFAVTIGGAIFLLAYAALAAKRALHPQSLEAARQGATTLKAAIATLLAFTLLNPHVYLDTVLLIGGISGQYHGADRVAFGIGATSASYIWFFGLGYGARWLSPLFAKASAWRVLDAIIAIVMLAIALSLLQRAFV